MYLSELKLWNFRRFWSWDIVGADGEIRDPDLKIKFHKGLNLIVGPNDIGKTAIIDAIKIVLKTHSNDRIKLDIDDFFIGANRVRIECLFEDIVEAEAAYFTERVWFEDPQNPYLRIILDTEIIDDRIKPFEIKWGPIDAPRPLTPLAKDKLRATYLKPLRDAENELIPKKWSRLSQILDWHPLFQNRDDHLFLQKFKEFTDFLKTYFNDPTQGKVISDKINEYLAAFCWVPKDIPFDITEPELRKILELLKLSFSEPKMWLGSQNMLFMATELLHMKRDDNDCLKLWLIEEVEAHLHPQNQMRVVEALQNDCSDGTQLIITTHSPNIGSKVKLENMIMIVDKVGFSMREWETKLESQDYTFLQRFLDVTKANLFFAHGIVLVEWWAEEILLPVIAKKIWLDFTKYGVSIVNVWSTAHLRYAKIFWRTTPEEVINLKVSVVTDLDIKHDDYVEADKEAKILEKQGSFSDISPNIKCFVSPRWTLEYCLACSDKFRKLLYKAVLEALLEEKSENLVSEWRIEDYRSEALNSDTHYDWTQDRFILANSIYKKILWEEKVHDNLCIYAVSKSIIAQHLAALIENQSDDYFDGIDQDEYVGYLIQSIKHACWMN